MTGKNEEIRIGKLPPGYKFMMNPYPDHRATRCPLCGRKNGQKKLPLLIVIKPFVVITLNFTSKYCSSCDLLVADKYKLEYMLAEMARARNSDVTGNSYNVIGTVVKQIWKDSMEGKLKMTWDELLEHTSDFMVYYKDLQLTQPGWFPKGVIPPVMEPPPSEFWVKRK